MAKNKTCSRCKKEFHCGSSEPEGVCWCNDYPPLFLPDPVINCLCRECLHKATIEKINVYVADMTAEKAITDNKAKYLPQAKYFIEGIDYYVENESWVFTAWHHLKRGNCCQNGCRHCPYGYKKIINH